MLPAALSRAEKTDVQQIVAGIGISGSHDVLKHIEAPEQPDVLKGARNPCPGNLMLGQSGELFSIQQHVTGVSLVDTGQEIEGSGLACAIGTDNPYDIVTGYLKGKIIDGLHAAKRLGDAFHL